MTAAHRSGIFCSLGDSRSWTDLTTNLVVLSDVQLKQNLEQLTSFGTAPRNLLPNFLHEATHHWCFLSPVGSTLAALQLRAQRHAMELLTKPETERQHELEHQLCEDLIRAETAEACLRPIAEGLALFTEFDAMTNQKSSIMSIPLTVAIQFFGNLKFSQTKLGLTPVLLDMLRWMRLDEHCIKRKVALFGKPFSYGSGGYLPGYLTVRSLWLIAAEKNARLLNETDLTLTYLRSFFFDDMSLVARLLDPSTKELESAGAIVNHISQRFRTFLDVEPSDIESWEQNVLLKYKDDWEQNLLLKYKDEQSALYLMNLHVDEELYSLGEKLQTELRNEFKSDKSTTMDNLLRLHAADIFGQRDVMYVGSLQIKVTVDKSGHFHALYEEALILEGKAVNGVADGSNEGSLDLFFSIHSKLLFKVITITRGEELVATKFLGPERITKKGALRFEQFKGQHSVLQKLRNDSNQAVVAVLKNSWMKIVVKHVRRQLPEMVEKIYLPIALAHVPNNKLETDYAIMRKDGLLSILNYDRDLIEGLALIGLICSSVSPHRMVVSWWFKRNGLDLDATLAKLQQCNEKYGLPLVNDAGGELISTI